MEKSTENQVMAEVVQAVIGKRTFRQWISDLTYKEHKKFIIEAYILDHTYKLQPKVKDQIKSVKQPVLRSLQKKYFFLETESKIKNRKIVKAVFENINKTYQLDVVVYRILKASSDIEHKGITNIKDIILEPPTKQAKL